MSVTRDLKLNPPSKDWVVMVKGRRLVFDDMEAAKDYRSTVAFSALWDCRDRENPRFVEASAGQDGGNNG